MDDEGLPVGEITGVELLGGGTQNILLRFVRGGEAYVLRHPPPHKRASSDETMRREARVLAAIAGTGVAHPRLIAACGDESVLGAAFYLMEPVDGANPTVGLPQGYLDSSAWRHQLGLAMAVRQGRGLPRAPGRQVAGAARLVRCGPRVPGPRHPGCRRGGGVVGRQPAHRLVPRAHPRRLPPRQRPVLTAPAEAGRHRRLGAHHHRRPAPRPRLAARHVARRRGVDHDVGLGAALGRLPTAAELVRRYAERSDRDLTAVAWYEVLACYKLGLILEGTHARAFAGLAPRETGDALHASTVGLFRRALARIGRT